MHRLPWCHPLPQLFVLVCLAQVVLGADVVSNRGPVDRFALHKLRDKISISKKASYAALVQADEQSGVWRQTPGGGPWLSVGRFGSKPVTCGAPVVLSIITIPTAAMDRVVVSEFFVRIDSVSNLSQEPWQITCQVIAPQASGSSQTISTASTNSAITSQSSGQSTVATPGSQTISVASTNSAIAAQSSSQSTIGTPTSAQDILGWKAPATLTGDVTLQCSFGSPCPSGLSVMVSGYVTHTTYTATNVDYHDSTTAGAVAAAAGGGQTIVATGGTKAVGASTAAPPQFVEYMN